MKSYFFVQKWNLTYQTLRNEVNCCNFRRSELDYEGEIRVFTKFEIRVLPSFLEVRCKKNVKFSKKTKTIVNFEQFPEICLHNRCSTLFIWDISWILELFRSNLYAGFGEFRTPPHYRADWSNDQKLSVKKIWGGSLFLCHLVTRIIPSIPVHSFSHRTRQMTRKPKPTLAPTPRNEVLWIIVKCRSHIWIVGLHSEHSENRKVRQAFLWMFVKW